MPQQPYIKSGRLEEEVEYLVPPSNDYMERVGELEENAKKKKKKKAKIAVIKRHRFRF